MGAYKQFLTSDIIVAPFEVHKDFSFKFVATSSTIQLPGGGKATVPGPNSFGGPYPGVGINRFLGKNIDYFDFNPNVDPITGNYTITGLGTISSASLSITPFYTEASTIGSSSFNLNGINILLTGSSGGINLGNRICIPTGSNAITTTNSIVSHINNSSSLYFNLKNILATQYIAPGPITTSTIIFSSKTREYINNFYYLISGSTTTYFNGGSNDTVSGEYQYQRLIYHSIQELYYSNYQECQYGDPDNPQVLIPGADSDGDRYIGSSNSQAHYDNYLQTTLSYPRFFPTASNARIGVITVPNTLFGDYIQPNSFYYTVKNNNTTYEFYDDGEGNLRLLNNFYGTSSAIVGNVIYTHGIITLTGNSSIYDYMNLFNSGQLVASPYATAIYGNPPVPQYVYGTYLDFNNIIDAFVSSSNVTCSFSSSYTIYETQYKCTIRENEFNYTLNPSTFTSTSSSFTNTNVGGSPCDINASSSTVVTFNPGIPYDYVNQDYFSPYITTIGLYDEQQNLLAIGKLSQPLPSSPTTDTTILINIDR